MRIPSTDAAIASALQLPQTAAGRFVGPGAKGTPASTVSGLIAELQISLIEVLAQVSKGPATIRADGKTLSATLPEGFKTGGTYVAELIPDSEPGHVTVRPVPDRPDLPVTVATAVLRSVGKPQDLTDVLPALKAEVTRLAAPPGQPPSTPVHAAAARVLQVLQTLVPPPARAPTAEDILTRVTNDGGLYEAKLARAVETGQVLRPDSPEVAGDLKASLLSLIKTASVRHVREDRRPDEPVVPGPVAGAAVSTSRLIVPDGAGEGSPVSVMKETVAGIEARQSVNALADTVGGPVVFHVAVPDGNQIRTAHVAVEPDGGGDGESESGPGQYRVLIHLTMTDLGETWIDAGVGSGRVRAVLYVSKDVGRAEARSKLPDLSAMLTGDGFADVLLDVRPAADLPAARRRRAAAMAAGMPETVSVFDVKA